jgi:hypothetical protein
MIFKWGDSRDRNENFPLHQKRVSDWVAVALDGYWAKLSFDWPLFWLRMTQAFIQASKLCNGFFYDHDEDMHNLISRYSLVV